MNLYERHCLIPTRNSSTTVPLSPHCLLHPLRGSEADCGVVRRRAQPRQVDTHAGYMLEEEEEEESARLRLVEDDGK